MNSEVEFDRSFAPWSTEQVYYLNEYQRAHVFHPFTCPNRGDGTHTGWFWGDKGVLVATELGWVCRHCDYTQGWAHSAMADGTFVRSVMESMPDWMRKELQTKLKETQ